jgi:hypothetical protein
VKCVGEFHPALDVINFPSYMQDHGADC